jgi:septal ring factor EnvC (AmiA/AmiB activator)
LIINVGDDYFLLLAGMKQIHVDVGQFVLEGEAVGTMGEKSSLSPVLVAVDTTHPVLYVELRKDGGSIDPQPWWVHIQAERAPG